MEASGSMRPWAAGLLWVGLALALASLANAGYLVCCEVIAYRDYDPGGSSAWFSSRAPRVRHGVGAMLFAALSIICALRVFRRAAGWYVRLALAEVGLSGLAFLTVLVVYWSFWVPM